MGEKSTIFQNTLIGLQTQAGTPATANKKLLATSFKPSPKVESERFRALGNKYASFATLNKEWSETSIEGKLTYNEILYLLASLLSQPTPEQQGTSAYEWVFSSSTSAEDAGKYLTIEQGDANSAWQVSDLRVASLTLTFNRNEASISGSGIGLPLKTGITLAASPTSLVPRPVLPGHVKLYTASSREDLNEAQAMTRGFSLVWALTDKYGLAWPVGTDPVVVETEPGLEQRLRVATDTAGLGYLTTMRSGDTAWFRVKCEGPTIADTYKHSFVLDFPAQVAEPGEMNDEDGLYLMEYTLTGIHDPNWGKAFEITIVTDVATL